MKTKSIFFICLTAYFPVMLNNCTEDGDTTKPEINLHEPADGAVLKIGDEHGVHFEADFYDNENLASYKIEIHHDFDGHEHEDDHDHEASLRAGDSTVPFTYNEEGAISGTTDRVDHYKITIPTNATPGDYHLMVYCTDAAGNEAHIAVDVELSHDAAEHHEHDEED